MLLLQMRHLLGILQELKYVSTGAYNLAGLKFAISNLVANNGVPDNKLNFLWQSSLDPVDKNDGMSSSDMFSTSRLSKNSYYSSSSTEIIGDGAVTLLVQELGLYHYIMR